jgi:GntR family transcriptional regulator
MFLRIDPSSGVPITRQIAEQIRSHCASGAVAPGDRLPSVRQLAQELAVNQNTILHIYERLTAEGLLERRQGDGTYVADRLPAGQMKIQRQLMRSEVQRLVQRARTLRLSAEAVLEMVEQALREHS